MKAIAAVFCGAILFLFLVGVSNAEDIAKKFGVGARLAYYDISDDQVRDLSLEWTESLLYEGMVTYSFTNSLSLELIGGFTETDLARRRSGVFIAEFGELKQIPVLLNARYVFWPTSEIGIYIGGGVGYYFNDFGLTDIGKSAFPGLTVEMDDSFGYQVIGGVEFFLNDKVSINWDARYAWNKVDYVERSSGSTEEQFEVDLDAFTFALGIKYYF
ncbi:MAG: outer membrane beta-barrel protein [Deltaproteobacteria bacterium]|nr:MAG: outer membrane beta-barrel protein [Deltaproteobacteria bacterium]